MHRSFRYVGPPEIAIGAERAPGGHALRSRDDVASAVRALGGDGVFTYVVDDEGTLRVADRGSEHVACARGGPVLAAGELALDGRRRAVVWATNLSTGFCPSTACFAALEDALAGAAIPGPASFEHAFEMRRCLRCGARQVVKDDVYECAECEADLPKEWNLDRARCERGWIRGGGTLWSVDALVERGSRDEDRVRCAMRGPRLAIALADGAGGTGRGAIAAERVVGALEGAFDRDASAILAGLDAELARDGAETTSMVISLDVGGTLSLGGASVGDARALALRAGEWSDLTAGVPRKPLLGSGAARPVAFEAREIDALLLGTDGLFGYADERALCEIAGGPSRHAPWELADRARLPSGALQDDLALVLVRRAPR